MHTQGAVIDSTNLPGDIRVCLTTTITVLSVEILRLPLRVVVHSSETREVSKVFAEPFEAVGPVMASDAFHYLFRGVKCSQTCYLLKVALFQGSIVSLMVGR